MRRAIATLAALLLCCSTASSLRRGCGGVHLQVFQTRQLGTSRRRPGDARHREPWDEGARLGLLRGPVSLLAQRPSVEVRDTFAGQRTLAKRERDAKFRRRVLQRIRRSSLGEQGRDIRSVSDETKAVVLR
eukprot:scaffold69_cov248-Pinguiococcus_pyrenoidosus.AAC.57